jgi:hypothetical protein
MHARSGRLRDVFVRLVHQIGRGVETPAAAVHEVQQEITPVRGLVGLCFSGDLGPDIPNPNHRTRS